MIDIKQSVAVIEQALNIASSKGVFALKDAAVVNQSLEVLKTYLESNFNDIDTTKETPIKVKK